MATLQRDQFASYKGDCSHTHPPTKLRFYGLVPDKSRLWCIKNSYPPWFLSSSPASNLETKDSRPGPKQIGQSSVLCH